MKRPAVVFFAAVILCLVVCVPADAAKLAYIETIRQFGDPPGTGKDIVKHHIRCLDLETGVSKLLHTVADRPYVIGPSWSSDGKLLAFSTASEGWDKFRRFYTKDQEVFSFDIQTSSKPKFLKLFKRGIACFTIIRSGELLYAAPEGDDIYGKGDVYLGNRLLLKRIQSVPTKIILSRDEKFYILLLPESETAQERIAYCSVDKGILKIFNLGRDVCVQFVDLSPDGKKILYDYGPYEGEETTTHLYTIEVATGKKKRLKLDTCRAFWDTSSSLITIDPRDSLSVVRRVDLNTGKSSKLATIKAGLSGQMAYSPK